MQSSYTHLDKNFLKLPFSAVEEIVTGREKKIVK